jgi:hypothetical protein
LGCLEPQINADERNKSALSDRCAAGRVGQVLGAAGFTPCCQFYGAALLPRQEFGRGGRGSGGRGSGGRGSGGRGSGGRGSGGGRMFAVLGGLYDEFLQQFGGGTGGIVGSRYEGRIPRFEGRRAEFRDRGTGSGGRGAEFMPDIQGAAGVVTGAVQRRGGAAQAHELAYHRVR